MIKTSTWTLASLSPSGFHVTLNNKKYKDENFYG